VRKFISESPDFQASLATVYYYFKLIFKYEAKMQHGLCSGNAALACWKNMQPGHAG
jgi:hypothetical protein